METTVPSAEILQQSFPQFIVTGLISSASLPATYQVTTASGQRQLILYIVPTSLAATVGWSESFMMDVAETVKFQHPNLVGISETGTSADGQYLYIAAEEEPAPSLIQIRLGEGIKPKDALIYTRGLALGLSLAHNKGIYHGRITPALISMVGGKIPKIIPFNISPLLTDKTQLEFFAPESLTAGARKTSKSDIYSLGLLLYFMLTGKTPSGTGFEMPSNHCKCSEEVDLLTAKAINPNPDARFGSCLELVSELENILPGCDTKTVRKPRKSALPNVTALSKEAAKRKGAPILYFYLIPALIIGIALAAISVSYRLDMLDTSKEIKALQAEKAKVERQNGWIREAQTREARKQAATLAASPAPVTAPTPTPSPAPVTPAAVQPAPVDVSPTDTKGLTNWCRESNVKVRSNEPFKHLSAYEAEKLIDGDKESIAATNPDPDKPSWFAVDFGKDNERPVSRIVIHAPVDNAQLGSMTKFSIKLANANKEIVAEKEFHSDGTPVPGTEIWELPEPVQARGLRIESLGTDQPLIIGELEVFGKP